MMTARFHRQFEWFWFIVHSLFTIAKEVKRTWMNLWISFNLQIICSSSMLLKIETKNKIFKYIINYFRGLKSTKKLIVLNEEFEYEMVGVKSQCTKYKTFEIGNWKIGLFSNHYLLQSPIEVVGSCMVYVWNILELAYRTSIFWSVLMMFTWSTLLERKFEYLWSSMHWPNNTLVFKLS